MLKRARYAFLFLLGFIAGVLFSYSSILMRPTIILKRDGIVLETASLRNETDFLEDKTEGFILRRTTTVLNQLSFNDSRFHGDDTTLADILFKNIKILCLVITYPENHQKKAIHAKATWGKRCNKLLFVTRTADENLPTLIVNVTDDRQLLGVKTRDAFDHAYKHYVNDYDWFLKADDDTYVIMENLRYFLSAQDHNSPVFFGQTFSRSAEERYASGGAGYIASREALRRFGLGHSRTEGCGFNTGVEDLDFGMCMASLGVKLGNSLDALGRTRFHCFSTIYHIEGDFPDWYYLYDQHNRTETGAAALSDYAISFHYNGPSDMYLMEYFIYHLNPYGIIKGLQNLNSMR